MKASARGCFFSIVPPFPRILKENEEGVKP
jgi:hypothetical protein